MPPLLRTIPFYVSPDIADHTAHTARAFTLPSGNAKAMNWTAVHGPVRFIGLDTAYDFGPNSPAAKWLEGVLKSANEKFIFALAHYPGYSSGRLNRKPLNYAVTRNTRQVVHPLLAKYKATAVISAQDFHYERCEPTPDKGVTQLVIGGGGAKIYRRSNRAGRENPFTNTGAFSYSTGFCVFEVKGNVCEMRYIPLGGPSKEGPADTRTFKARN